MTALGDFAHSGIRDGRHTGSIMLTSHTAPHQQPGRPARPAVFAVLAVVIAVVAMPGQLAGAAPAKQPACDGAVISAEVRAASLPGGSYRVNDACVPREAFFEVGMAGFRLALGLGAVNYEDGHFGRIAFAALTAPDGRALTLVGVEDPTVDLVRWALAQGTHSEGPVGTAVTGEGPTDAPGAVEETARVDLAVAGTGTDLMTARGEVPEMLRDLVLDAVEQLQG